jgi:hypothetical protein
VKGILNVVAGVPATVLMITGSVGETGIHIKIMCIRNIKFIVKSCWLTLIHPIYFL